MRLHEHDIRRGIARHTAKAMFVLALAFLFCQAVLVVLWANVPMLVEISLGLVDANSTQARELRSSLAAPVAHAAFQTTTNVMLLIWPVVALETVYHWLSRPWNTVTRKYHYFGLLFCVCPSLRMCARSPELGSRIWLPGLGWRVANKRLRTRLERRFSVPMILIALMIMPVLIVDFFMKAQVAQYAWLRLLLHFCTGVIWFAFATEFILMFSVAKRKIDYCKKHWIDLAIILLPFIMFVRSLRVLQATRAVNLIRVTQISKFARVYRLRGTAIKALRALVLLDLFQRLTGGPESKIKRLKSRLSIIETEAKQLRRKVNRLQRTLRERESECAAESTSGAAEPGPMERDPEEWEPVELEPEELEPVENAATAEPQSATPAAPDQGGPREADPPTEPVGEAMPRLTSNSPK